MNRTYEVAIELKSNKPAEAEILSDLLHSCGAGLGEIIELSQWGKQYLSVYFDNRADASTLKRKVLKVINTKKIDITLKSLKEEDWLTKWKREFKPFMLTESIKIIPAWLNKKYRTSKTPVFIDTGMAFGTGLHATTRFMAGFVEKCRGSFKSFLDIGTGTGILAIIAAKMGAESVEGLDISPDAIKIAKDNFAVNECVADKLKACDFGKFKTDKKYDFVAANLITHDLLNFKQKIIALVKKDGYLAVSGISINNYKLFREKFVTNKLKCLKIEKSEGWAALLFKKVS